MTLTALILLAISVTGLLFIGPRDTSHPRGELHVGARVRWVRRGRNGKVQIRSMVITVMAGELVRLEALIGRRRVWVRRNDIARKP
jgi:hypothetical protein